jgi:hypothetical protein
MAVNLILSETIIGIKLVIILKALLKRINEGKWNCKKIDFVNIFL